MMGWDAFSLPFMQRALAVGLLVSALAAMLGVFVVQRRWSFLGDGLAHAAFGGAALGLLIGVPPLLSAIPYTLAVAHGIPLISRHSRVATDTAIGILFAVSMALGVIFLSLRQASSADAFTYLFGSILAVSPGDLAFTGALSLLALGCLPCWGRWAYATFDRDQAVADRLPVARDDAVLMTLIALTVVCAIKTVGAVLITAFLVIPPATARLLAPTFSHMTLLAVGIALFCTATGLWLSYPLDIPSGPTIILLQALVFCLALVLRRT